MEGEESLLDSIFDMDNVEDMDDVDMVDVEEGEMVGNSHQTESGQTNSSVDGDALPQQPLSKRQRRRNKKNKKNKRKKGGSESDVTDINRFVLNTCRHLKEKKSYLIWTAVGCLGVSALSDLVKEVDAIQACGGQKTADGTRYKFGGGFLWSILKARDPNAFKEIMTKGKEFEKLNKRNKAPYPSKQSWSKAEGIHAPKAEPVAKDENMLTEEKQMQRRPVHDRIRVPVSYDDLLEVENPKEEAI